jgi:hypothetical protein
MRKDVPGVRNPVITPWILPISEALDHLRNICVRELQAGYIYICEPFKPFETLQVNPYLAADTVLKFLTYSSVNQILYKCHGKCVAELS